MFSSLWNFLTTPTLPRTSLALTPTHFALIEMQKRGGNFNPKRLAVQSFPAGILQASLTEPNINKESEFISLLTSSAEQAGFSRKLKLSVTLPEGSAHSIVATLDQKPKTRAELEQMLEWKIGRATNLKASEMRNSYHPLVSQSGQPRWLVAAIHKQVLEQYERLFSQLGWQVGVVLPQHLGEAQWLMRHYSAASDEDQILVSVSGQGFVVVVVRGTEPLLIREVTCSPEEREDELYRLMVFYRDRLNPTQPIKGLLIIGDPTEQAIFAKALTAALEQNPPKVTPISLGLNLDANAPFHRLAAAAGLASMAY